ncbi:MAG: phosphotransferase family protein [Actinobacteria bacterium]|nr:phosphotransferase family protein [Actinomycetota bacterium]
MTSPSDEAASRAAAAANYVDIQHHSGDAEFAGRLRGWLADRLPDGSDPQVGPLDTTGANGMSSDTVLFDATWSSADGTLRPERHRHHLVLRTAPDADATPVFPRYDLEAQFATLAGVAENSAVPVPKVWWCETDPEVLGRPFFVMSRASGHVPPDVLPYTFGDNWVADGTEGDRAAMQRSMVEVLAGIHGIDDAASRFSRLRLPTGGPTALARHLADTTDWYTWSCRDSSRSLLVESALERLTDTLPDDPGPTVLCWGDARIGNVVFDGFDPVGVLDWENAVLGPREIDVMWLTYSHTVFQDLATGLGAKGLPRFLRLDDVAATYQDLTGHVLVNLDWHALFAATRWAIVFLRTGAREAAVTGRPLPDDGDTLLHNRPSLERLLAR